MSGMGEGGKEMVMGGEHVQIHETYIWREHNETLNAV
jgi:hypothetical protein